MNIESFREYCLSKPKAIEDFPFDEVTLVFKVCGKMFALTSLDLTDFNFNLKCDPERAVELREQYSAIQPGYHMSKKHWNTVFPDGSLSDKIIKELIDHSYDCVVKGLTKKEKEELAHLNLGN